MKPELLKSFWKYADPEYKLQFIHNKVKFEPEGELENEYIEQLMLVEFINGDEKILEFGANIGRTSIVASTLLDNDKNLVCIEPGDEVGKLENNKLLNNRNFSIFGGALSYRPIWKPKDSWQSTTDPNHSDEHVALSTLTFEEIEEMHNITFDTFLIDCEGAFYNILQDNPNILKNIKKIFIENDFDQTRNDKELVHQAFRDNGFKVIKEYPIDHWIWGQVSNFWQVWVKDYDSHSCKN